MTRKANVWVAVAVLAMGLAVAGCSSATSDADAMPETLRVGLIPNISPDKQKAQYEPLKTYLQDTLKVKVELFVATDYAGVVTALVAKQIDIAYLGGLTYAQAKQQAHGVTPLVTEIDELTGTKLYQSAIVAKTDAPYSTTKDVVAAGARFAFGDIASTSGSLYPRIMITEAGGIGQALGIALKLFRYQELATLIITVLIIIIAVDRLSMMFRTRVGAATSGAATYNRTPWHRRLLRPAKKQER